MGNNPGQERVGVPGESNTGVTGLQPARSGGRGEASWGGGAVARPMGGSRRFPAGEGALHPHRQQGPCRQVQPDGGEWRIGKLRYEGIARNGGQRGGPPCSWSFTSDGKNRKGRLVQVSEVHPLAFGIEAKLPAGIGRMIYGPAKWDGFHWVAEAKTRQGWRWLTEHHDERA